VLLLILRFLHTRNNYMLPQLLALILLKLNRFSLSEVFKRFSICDNLRCHNILVLVILFLSN
jgi:hypothetical protein